MRSIAAIVASIDRRRIPIAVTSLVACVTAVIVTVVATNRPAVIAVATVVAAIATVITLILPTVVATLPIDRLRQCRRRLKADEGREQCGERCGSNALHVNLPSRRRE
jgi:Na+/melibiose symporter-like transporter